MSGRQTTWWLIENLLFLPLFNFACLSVLSFLSSQHICYFYFHCFIPQLALCFSFVFQFVLSFILVDIIFVFLCLPGQSIVLYFCWTVFILLMGVCICVYSVTLFIVINLCIYIWPLQFCGAFSPPPRPPTFKSLFYFL